MFILQSPPDTSIYMIAGYVIAFATMFIYVASLFIRFRNLNRELTLLEEMGEEN